MKVRSVPIKGWRTATYIVGRYRRSARYVFHGSSRIRCLLVGSVLFFAATVGVGVLFFVAPLPLLPKPALFDTLPLGYFVTFELLLAPIYGYLFRVVQQTMKLDPVPPGFRDWNELVLTGLNGSIITLVLLDVPMFYPGLAIDIMGRLLPLPFGLGDFFPVVLLSAVFVYPAAFVSVAESGRLRDALAIRRFKQLLMNWNYVIIAVPTIGIMLLRTVLVSASLTIWRVAINVDLVRSSFAIRTTPDELVLYGMVTSIWLSPVTFYLFVTTHRVVGSHWLAVTGSERRRPFDPLAQFTLDDFPRTKND